MASVAVVLVGGFVGSSKDLAQDINALFIVDWNLVVFFLQGKQNDLFVKQFIIIVISDLMIYLMVYNEV